MPISEIISMLEIESLVAGYGGVPVLRDINLKLGAGEIVGLLGANNAGKTTLINSLSGTVRPMSGRILFQGEDITRMSPRQRVEIGIVQVPEGRLVFPEMSIRENLLLGGINSRAKPHRRRQMDKVLELFPRLGERLSQSAGSLSGGEQQMLAIGRILRTGARLLLLDEPTEGLAPVIIQQIGKTIGLLKQQGFTILLVEQNFRFASTVADRYYVMEHGRIIDRFANAELEANLGKLHEYLGV
jgi:branched-chain amino acid transport system ATP-binding protein